MDEAAARKQLHEDEMAQIRHLESQLVALAREMSDVRTHTQHELGDLKEKVERLCTWMQNHSARSAWFYNAEPELREVVEGSQWLKNTKRLIVWASGLVAGVIMAWNAVDGWIRGRW